jgi:hypothetical protein
MLRASADPRAVARTETGAGDHARKRDDQRDDPVDFLFRFFFVRSDVVVCFGRHDHVIALPP